MIAYKLVRKLKNGELSPLFINKKSRLVINKLYAAESHPTKGFKYRKGWHCCLKPLAPHLTIKDRVWVEVEIEERSSTYYSRPESQGGKWVLAEYMIIKRELTDSEVENINNK